MRSLVNVFSINLLLEEQGGGFETEWTPSICSSCQSIQNLLLLQWFCILKTPHLIFVVAAIMILISWTL